MKKKYMTPEMQVIKLNMQQPMLTASLGLKGEGTGTQFSREEDFFEDYNF